MKAVPSSCPNCGKPASASTDGGDCAYCLLQLALGAPVSLAGSASGRLSSVGGAKPIAASFVRQGVLPRFGDYELESEIARGGMGVVYRARQRSLNRTVAIKMILAGQLATPESVQRFRLEAEAAARLHHPAIVRIFEVGEYETQHFFSMELIEGVSLAECIEDFTLQKQSTAAEKREQEKCIAELMGAVARALDFAHQRGVLHRDLKPSNILIDEQGRPHLTDFGLAKLTGREASGLTLSAAVLGTPGYLAPEQAAGRPDEVTTAADVYGLGATLYELLTGQPPFVGSTALETMWMAIERAPTPPRQLNPAVHRDLETIALRCLEKEPQRRYASAGEVADELERFLHHKPIRARPVSVWEHAWRWRQRNPWLAGLAAALLVAILAGSATALWQWQRAEQANVTLTENVAHLEWGAIDTMLEQGESSQALARVAALVRQDPGDWQAAMFAMSILEQRRFPVPAAPPIRHPDGAELTVARLSPDGTRIVTASFDTTVRLWDSATSQEVTPPLKHDGPVTWAEFRPDGRILATCSEDKSVRFWEVATGKPIGEPTVYETDVKHLQFSSDGRRLLARGNRHISILDGDDGRVLIGPLRPEGNIVAARFLAGDEKFFTAQQAGENSLVRVWDAATGAEHASLKAGPLRTANLSDDGSRVVVSNAQSRGWIADFPSGRNRQRLTGHNGLVTHVGFNAASDLFYSVSLNQFAQVWRADTGQPVTDELSHYYLLNGAAFVEEGQRLLTWGDDALAQVWDIAAGRAYCEPMRHPNRVVYAEHGLRDQGEVFLTTLSHLKSRSADTRTGAAQLWKVLDLADFAAVDLGYDPAAHDGARFTPDGRLIALGKTVPHVVILDAQTGEQVCDPLQIEGGAWGVLISPDGRRLVVATSAGQVSLWSIPEGQPIGTPVKIGATIQPAEMAVDGKHFATGSTDGYARLWDTATGQIVYEMRHGSEINSVAFSPDGAILASAGEDRVVRLWSTATGESLRELRGHQNEVMVVNFAPDSRRLVTACLDFTGRVWDALTGEEVWALPHQGEVIDASFSPDGHWIATASRDRTAVIWDAATGRPHQRRLLHEQGVRNVQFSPDGAQLLTLDFRGLRLWDVATCHPLTVHLPQISFGGTGFQDSSTRPAFSPDGQSALVGMDGEWARVWRFSIPPAGAPEWFPELLEAIAGQRLNVATDRPELVPADRFLELQQRLRVSADTDAYTRWSQRRLFGEARNTTAVER